MDRRRASEPSLPGPWPFRVKLEAALSAICGVLAVLTGFVPDWIERFLDASPDAGSGEAEWGIVLGFAVAAMVAGGLARHHWRRWVAQRA